MTTPLCIFRQAARSGGAFPRLGLLFLVGFFTPAASGHAQALERAPGAEVNTVTPAPGFFTEPSIAVNPRDPRQVVAAFQDNAHIAYSLDAGRHWQVASGTASTRYRVSGDVSVVYDARGRAILCYMAFDKLGTFNYWGHDSSRNGLYIRRSLDGGKTWGKDDIPVSVQPNRSDVPWEDKPYIVADDSHGPHSGNLYIGWTRWTLTGSLIMFTRSTDGGLKWSKPIEIDNGPGLPRDDNGALQGFDGTVGPHSTVYAVWNNGTQIVFTDSHDGGRSFARPREIIRTGPPSFKVDAVPRSNGFPQIGIDPKTGRLFVTWSDYRYGEVDVFCSTSANRGRTWSPAVKVNTDPAHDGSDHFFQWLAVDPSTGDAYVVFYDRRGDPANRSQIVALARSTDGGQSFQNYAWMGEPFSDQIDGRGAFMGDYTGIAALDGRVYGVWTVKPPPPPGPMPRFAPGRPSAASRAEYEKYVGTLIQVGVADFSGPAPPARPGTPPAAR